MLHLNASSIYLHSRTLIYANYIVIYLISSTIVSKILVLKTINLGGVYLTIDLIKDKDKRIHFIGIGGISMSGLAEILLQNNFCVSGSDMKQSNITNKLSSKGANIIYGHKEENVYNSDLIVYTAAISQDNPEIIMAKKLNIPLMDRAEFLGQLMKAHKYNIAV